MDPTTSTLVPAVQFSAVTVYAWVPAFTFLSSAWKVIRMGIDAITDFCGKRRITGDALCIWWRGVPKLQ